MLKYTWWYSKCRISLRGVRWDGTSRGQSQGARNWQWPHGWRGRGRHCGHCWSARGAEHSSNAGNLFCITLAILCFMLPLIRFFLKISIPKVENELVDLIDELLERDAGTVNSTIIGNPHVFMSDVEKDKIAWKLAWNSSRKIKHILCELLISIP